MYWLRIMREGGWLIALAVALLALFMAWLAMNPVEEAADHVVAPVARSVGIIEGRCPSGWEHNYFADHVVAETCSKGSITVTLYPYLKKANYGLDTRGGDGTTTIPCKEIPDWPESWCLE